jgi:transposase
VDNLPAHKPAAIRRAIRRAGAEPCFLPPYSPDLNPIEKAFAKLKALPKKAAARSLDDLRRGIADALPRFTADECNYFTDAGYKSVTWESALVA